MTDLFTPMPVERIRDGERVDLEANVDECEAIARRLDLLALHRLGAHVILTRAADGSVACEGRVRAALAQACIATGEPVEAAVDEPFTLNFQRTPVASAKADEEIELGEDELDTVFFDGSDLPLGDAIVDTLGLSLDPYPRSAGADAALKAAGVLSEEDAGPFAGLAALRDKLGGKDA